LEEGRKKKAYEKREEKAKGAIQKESINSNQLHVNTQLYQKRSIILETEKDQIAHYLIPLVESRQEELGGRRGMKTLLRRRKGRGIGVEWGRKHGPGDKFLTSLNRCLVTRGLSTKKDAQRGEE